MAAFGHRGWHVYRHPRSRGGTSTQYTPSAGDLGKWLKATVTYDDVTGTDWTGERITNVLSQPTVSNASYGDHNFVGYSNNDPVTHRYAQGSRPERTCAVTG